MTTSINNNSQQTTSAVGIEQVPEVSGIYECRTCGKVVDTLRKSYSHILKSYGLFLNGVPKETFERFINEKDGFFL